MAFDNDDWGGAEDKGPKKPRKSADEIAAEMADFKAAYRQQTVSEVWTRDDTGHDLTVEEALFVRSYIIDRNPVAALKRLGYTGDSVTRLKAIAARHLNNPEVQAAIEVLAKRMMENLEITAERVNRRLAQVAFFDPRKVMSFDGVSLRVLPSELWDDDAAAALAGVEMTKDAGVKVKFHDSLRATEMLGKQLNIIKDPQVEAAKAAAEAAASSAISKIMDRLSKRPEGSLVEALPAPDEAEEVPEGAVRH